MCCLGNLCKRGELVLLLPDAPEITAKKEEEDDTFVMEFSFCLFPPITEENTEYISYIYFHHEASEDFT